MSNGGTAVAHASDGDDQAPDQRDVIDDVDELIMCLDCSAAEEAIPERGEDVTEEEIEAAISPGVPDSSNDAVAVPWLDRYDTTDKLISQLEDTLTMMEAQGVNLTSAWELANTARSLLDSADVIQALIYANRSFRIAREVHRLGDRGVGAAS